MNRLLMHRTALAGTFALAAALIGTTAAHAQTYYTTSATFITAAPTAAIIQTFEGIAPLGGSSANNAPISPLTVTVTNSSFSTNYYNVDDAGIFTLNGSAALRAGLAFNTLPTVTINLGGLATAFGTEIGFRTTSGSFSDTFTLALYNGNTQVGSSFSSASLTTSYIGVTSTSAFDNVRVTTGSSSGAGPYQVYDNVRANVVASAAPEPGSVALLLMGVSVLSGVLIARRKKRCAV